MASAPSTNILATVPKLDGSNYFDWKFAIELVLRRSGCWAVATGETPKPELDTGGDWAKLAEESFLIIGMTVHPSQYPHIRKASITNGPQAWSALKDVYEKKSRANRITLKHAFYGFQQDRSKSVQDYINGITGLAAQLQSIGVTLTDEDITDVIIFNLSSDYANIAGALTATKELTLTDITGALLEEEARRSAHESDNPNPETTALLVRGSQNRGVRKCFVCDRPGHIAANCEYRANKTRANVAIEYF